MGEFSDGNLDALAAQLVGLAADVGPDPLNEEPELHGGVDVRAALHGLRGGSSVAVSVVAGDGVGPPGAALAEEGYRVRNCRKAREAREKKKRQKVQHIAAQNPRFDGGIADVGGRIVHRALPLAIMPAPVVVPSAVMHTIQRGLATPFGGPIFKRQSKKRCVVLMPFSCLWILASARSLTSRARLLTDWCKPRVHLLSVWGCHGHKLTSIFQSSRTRS